MNATKEQLSHLSNQDLAFVKNKVDEILKERGVNISDSVPIKKTMLRAIAMGSGIFRNHNYIASQLMDEDWNKYFKGKYDHKRDYYVYYHCDPGKLPLKYILGGHGIRFAAPPFYIGKGKGDRLTSLSRSKGHLMHLKSFFERGFIMDDIAYVLKDGLTEKEALILEAKMIVYLGTKWGIPEKEIWHTNRPGGCLINIEVPPHPSIYDQRFTSEWHDGKKKKVKEPKKKPIVSRRV